jgi:hypothetical protein
MFGKIKGLIAVVCGALLIGATNASALDFTTILPSGLSTGDVDSVMGLIIVGLAAMWGFRKVIKTMNRS